MSENTANKNFITIKGARENNLKNINLKIPRNKMVVFTGISGSGKSTLAFDTIFAEGQRRYIESLSSYARQFLGQTSKPDVDSIEGLSPAISIDQKTTSKNPRSTVGTITEIYDYLRLLYAKVGKVHCPNCGKEITRQSIDQIVDRIMAMGESARIMVQAPVVRGKKGEFVKMFEHLRNSGYVRVKIDGHIYTLDEEIKLEKNIRHNISVVVDRLIINKDILKRLTESVENALKLSGGLAVIDNGGVETLFSEAYACVDCDISIEEIEPRLFSFNSPFGACPDCTGLGFKTEIDPTLLIKDDELSINQGAIAVHGWNLDTNNHMKMHLKALSAKYGFSMDTPFKELPQDIVDIIFYGAGDQKFEFTYKSHSFSGQYYATYEGVVNNLARRYRETSSEYIKYEIEKYMKTVPCQTCHGKRLRKEALSVKVGGLNIFELCEKPVHKCYQFFEDLKLKGNELVIAQQVINEIKARLKFLVNVGLDYLTLSRSSGTLSGGEAQRIRLATQIGSGLMGVVYILDEPSIGLHQRDNGRLLSSLKGLRDLGNTLIVVEHDEETIREADYIVDIGPGAGEHGGKLVATGSLQDIIDTPESITGKYLSGKKHIAIPKKRRTSDKYLVIKGARENNLKNIDVAIPIGVMTAITGVSGSGKSSLINYTLYPALASILNRSKKKPANCDDILGLEYLDKVIDIDQSPIGRTPRSNPATYTGTFTMIRELFASTPDAQERGYRPGRFSFNVKGGRCEACQGDGIKKIEMHFLPDVYVPCEVCKGKRYNRETLQVRYKGKNIADVLHMTVDEAMAFFENLPSIYRKIKTLHQVGLGYIRLGQSATTLSGGEAQRVKLATELSKRSTGKTAYILDEPTTGLHMADVDRLIKVLQSLVEGGNTMIIIEHNLDVIKVCDYIIDLGPEGGEQGGQVIAKGSPEEIARMPHSYTGQYLKKVFERG
ncbi:MAG TPA: excinuclease ABC subunit UvrA [Clostridiales bacterium]|nr:excinuclease ABC subunit UvrA [Clostridiales bacterium]